MKTNDKQSRREWVMIGVRIYPIIANFQIIDTIKEVYLFGVLVYRKHVAAPQKWENGEMYVTDA